MPNTELLQLVHDTVGPANSVKGAAELIKKGELTPAETLMLLNGIIAKADEINSAIDSYFRSQQKK